MEKDTAIQVKDEADNSPAGATPINVWDLDPATSSAFDIKWPALQINLAYTGISA